ncbi:hypothetical protein ACVWZR_007612 [Bradyrhizobium sp. i1.3.1]
MGFFTKDIKTLNDLFVRALQDIYYAEQQIAKNLPEMIEKATDPRHQERLPDASFRDQGPDHPAGEGVEMHGVAAKGVECPAIDGIRKEASEVSGDIDDKQVMDAALIAAGAGRRALRDHALRYSDRLGRRTWPRRDRALPDHEPQRGESVYLSTAAERVCYAFMSSSTTERRSRHTYARRGFLFVRCVAIKYNLRYLIF